MECNKDEAIRAKQIAENKMQAGDFEAGLKFASKAQRLFPDTQNIVQILTVCEVHCAAQKKQSGSDMDWYGILQTPQSSDEATIKKQYRKLALLLHPDKNKSCGAEAAFKLIGEANRVLSDQSKRSLYDSKYGVRVGNTAPKVPPRHPNGNSFGTKYDGTARNHPNSFYSQTHAWNPYHQVENQNQTFWTCCPHCNTKYEYYKTILYQIIRCQHCSKSFKAHDTGHHNVTPGFWSPFMNQKEPPKHASSKEAPKSNVGKSCGREQEGVSMSKCTAGVGAYSNVAKSRDGHVAAAGMTKGGVGMSNPTNSKANESQTSTKVGHKRARQSASDDDSKAGNGKCMRDTKVQENSVDPHRRSSRKKQHVSYTETDIDGDFGSSSKRAQHHESFTTTAVPATGGFFSNNNPASSAGVSHQDGEMKSKATAAPEETVVRNKTKVVETNMQRKEASNSDLKANNHSPRKSNLPPSSEIFCPDPDFSDFERDKAEDCFAVNQLWAIFDNTDSMPRFYALVKKVYSPFKLRITWLEPDSDDQGEIDWHEAGLPVACGKFKLGHSQRTTDRFMFSHQMHCIKGSDTATFLVYPKKGETWAIFRNWDIGWSSNPENHIFHQFEYVEVLSDFDEIVGIEVAYLGKLKGFVSLFQQSVLNGISLFCIPPNELYRFSHRIPSYKMTGSEREDVPRGSFELDPAGLPDSIFEVVDPGVVETNGVNCSHQEYSKPKVEQTMSNASIPNAKLRESNAAERVSQILRRSSRSSQKSMDKGESISSQYTVKMDDKNIGHRSHSPPEGNTAASQTNEGKVKTHQKHEKNNSEGERLKAQKSPRDLSKKNAQGDAGEWTTSKSTDNHSNGTKMEKGSNVPQSMGASSYGFKKEKSKEMFQCGQIWAIYGDRDHMPDTYVQIMKIEFTPIFRLQVSVLEPCSPPNDLKRTISCGTFKVKKGKLQIRSLSAFSHQLNVGPMVNNIYDIYPRKGEIWALHKDQDYELTSSNQGRGECHIVEVLADSDKSIEVVVLMPQKNSKTIFKTPRIQRSKTGVIEISREEVGRFSHQIPAFQHSGEDNIHLRGCWELDPCSVPGSFIQID